MVDQIYSIVELGGNLGKVVILHVLDFTRLHVFKQINKRRAHSVDLFEFVQVTAEVEEDFG